MILHQRTQCIPPGRIRQRVAFRICHAARLFSRESGPIAASYTCILDLYLDLYFAELDQLRTRRWCVLGILMSSRYLATVLRVTWMP